MSLLKGLIIILNNEYIIDQKDMVLLKIIFTITLKKCF